MARSLIHLCCLLVGVFTLVCQALAEPWQERLYVNGFYTVDYTYTDEDIGLVSNNKKPRAYDDDANGLENSLLGAQLEFEINGNLSVFAQGKVSFSADNNASTSLDWAYGSFDLGSDSQLRAGKFQTPFLQGTELRNIGYTRIWARPLIPEDGASGFNQYLGIEYLKRFTQGLGNWQIQLAAGIGDHEEREIESRNLELVALRYQYQNFWLRSAFLHGEYAIEDDDGQRITFSGNVIMASLEGELDLSWCVINAGYSSSLSDITDDDTIYYVSLGFPMGRFTPFIYTAKRNRYFEAYDPPPPPPPPGGGPPPPPPPPPVGDHDVNSVAAGVSWHLSERYGVKFQFENIVQNNRAGADTSAPANDGNTVSILFEGVF